MNSIQVLVVEDDTHIREGLVDTLESEGYVATGVADGIEALRVFRNGAFDLILLDVMMPGKSGYDVCREIRKEDDRVPVIMLTAKGEEVDKVVGLELGADDYVTKPFGIRELLARIHAVLRRAGFRGGSEEPAYGDVFTVGRAEIRRSTYRGRLGDRAFDLTPREMSLLEYFHSRPNVALTRDRLLRGVWEYDYVGTTRTVDQHIAQLRKKVEVNPSKPAVLTTVHGVGYRYEAEPEAS